MDYSKDLLLNQYLWPLANPLDKEDIFTSFNFDYLSDRSLITTASLRDSSVTNAKVGTINASKVTAGTITSAVIYSGTIAGSQITAGTIDASLITVSNINANNVNAGTLNASLVAVANLNAGSITTGTLDANRIGANTITGSHIAGSTIEADEIATDAITTRTINALAVTSNEIAGSAITAAKIDAGAVTAGKIDVSSLSAITATLGSVTAGTITASRITGGTIAGTTVMVSGGVLDGVSAVASFGTVNVGASAAQPFYCYGVYITTSGAMDMGNGTISSCDKVSGPSGNLDLNNTGRLEVSNHFDPPDGGSYNLGGASRYWGDVSYKTLTDRGCLGWFDEGVELQDGSKVSDIVSLSKIEKDSNKTTVYGVPMLNYKTLPKVVYKKAMGSDGIELPRDGNDEPYWIDDRPSSLTFGQKLKASDGAETTALISIMLG